MPDPLTPPSAVQPHHGGGHPHRDEAAPATTGHLIHWAWLYDAVVRVISFGRDRAIRRWTVAQAAIRPGESVLDVGCGTGDLTLAARAQTGAAGSVVGLDASPEMIAVARRKAARKRADVDFRVGLIEATGFPDRTFDVVLSSLMLHHLPGDLKRRGLEECRRVLKPGGRLVVVDFAQPAAGARGGVAWLHPAPGASAHDLAALAGQAGFIGLISRDTPFRPLGYVCGRAPEAAE